MWRAGKRHRSGKKQRVRELGMNQDMNEKKKKYKRGKKKGMMEKINGPYQRRNGEEKKKGKDGTAAHWSRRDGVKGGQRGSRRGEKCRSGDRRG